MANFIDFVITASKDDALIKEFTNVIEKSTPEELTDWFNSKGFTVTEEEAAKLIDNKDTVKKAGATTY